MRHEAGVAAGRTWSLQREWSKAFTIMLVLLLAMSLTIFAGVRQLVGEFREAAFQVDLQSTAALSLENAVNAHEDAGHRLLAGVPASHTEFLREQDSISAGFADARATFLGGAAVIASLTQAEQAWRAALSASGLWGQSQLAALTHARPDQQEVFGTSSDLARTRLHDVQEPSIKAVRKRLAADQALERVMMAVLLGLFLLGTAVTFYFRRRMTRDLMRPVAGIHAGVLKLRAGEFDHRIVVSRRDELGELAEAFNGMAAALHDSHTELTLRANHDSLTGLANRSALLERLASSFAPGSERRARHESVLFVDIDDFKDVNDSVGHVGGDDLLVQLAARLNRCVRPQDLVARLGGDEFAIVVVEDSDGSTAVEIAERILAALHAPFSVGRTRLVVSVSIGVAQRRATGGDAADMLQRADFAMYMAKSAGKGCYRMFDADVHATTLGRSALKTDLAEAVATGQLRIDYQPVADLRTGRILGVEALVRWQHPNLGLLAPSEFIPLAEETGDIRAIGCWVLETAGRQVARWRATVEHCEHLSVAVNLSAMQVRNPACLAAIARILADPTVHAASVVLEVTESALAADADGGILALDALKHLGVRIAIDDFGTGFSSLSTLANLPVDILKIDRSFVSGPASTLPSAPMLEGILGLADKLSLDVIAEGIETPEQLDLLRSLGCVLGQGYLLARPLAPSALEALLRAGACVPVPVPAI